VLLDRERELAAIEDWLDDAHDGRGRIAVAIGSAGIGKSALLAEAAALGAEKGLRVLSARGSELERSLPFGVARQLFEAAVLGLEDGERERVLSGPAKHARALLALAGEGTGGGDSLGVIHGLYWLAANLCERTPLLLAIDDLHWSDPETGRWLRYISRRLSDLPVLVLAAARSGEAAGEELASVILGDQDGRAITPKPLGERSVGQLVSTWFGSVADGQFVAACHSATGGNPFFLHELLRAALADGIEPSAAHAARVLHLGPREVARSILVRLGRLGAPAVGLANAVATLGADAELRHAAALCELDVDGALRVWDDLARAEILQPAQPLEFIHPIVRASVYREIAAGERTRAHRRAAVILNADGAESSRIAVHAAACEPAGDANVVGWLREAAKDAVHAGAPDAAALYLRRALDEPPAPDLRPEVHYELGQALVGRDPVAAATAFSETAAHAGLPLQLLASRWEGATLALAGRLTEAMPALERAIALARGDAELELLVGATRDHYAVFWADDPARVQRRRRLHEGAPALEGKTPGERRVLAIAALSISQTAAAPMAKSLELANRVRANLPTWLDSDDGVETASGIGHSGIVCDDPEGIARHERAMVQNVQRGWLINLGFGHLQQSMIRFRLGDLLAAESDARVSWELLGPLREAAPVFHWWSASALLQALIGRGQLDEAAALIESTGVCRQPLEFVMHPSPVVLAGELALAQGRLAEGVEMLLRAGAWLEDRGFTNPAYIPWRARVAPALAAAGRTDEALEVIEPAVNRARFFGAPWALGMALRAAGTVEQAPHGVELLREAITILEASGCRVEHAHARLELGAALRRSNHRSQAREHLRIALDLAHRCGDPLLAGRAAQELAATGARPRRVMLSGVESLTASERRVAELAAAGLSNREIAQTLFVTRKTVETHLGHVYLKLDVSSRLELPSALGPGDPS
jgi:DNA-binding CsgD family transcriptional regulator